VVVVKGVNLQLRLNCLIAYQLAIHESTYDAECH